MKDKNNLLDFNLWSCGEYGTPVYATSGNLIYSNNFSSIGENCIEYIQPHSVYWNFFLFYINKNILQKNTTYVVSFDTYCPEEYFVCSASLGGELGRVYVYGNKFVQHIELSFTTPSSFSEDLKLRFFNNVADTKLFVDNIKLIIT